MESGELASKINSRVVQQESDAEESEKGHVGSGERNGEAEAQIPQPVDAHHQIQDGAGKPKRGGHERSGYRASKTRGR